MPDSAAPISYVLRRVYAVRLLGAFALVTGAAMLLAVAVRALSWPAWLQLVLLLAAALLGVATLLLAGVTLRPVTLLRVDAEGFRIRCLRGVGPRQGSWGDVEDVLEDQRAGEPLALIRHGDGRTSVLPLPLLDAPALAVERDIRQRLDAANGYRRLSRAERESLSGEV
jgi:hypothetical protein